ncbi:hypothetical protein MMC28_011158 [Mycoblastus sanguinarius]|nr:hypothetical protein [Mycoblastus sanguinarius]
MESLRSAFTGPFAGPSTNQEQLKPLAETQHAEIEGLEICGNDDEIEVFAQAACKELRIVFRYQISYRYPKSLQSRIVTCFYELPAQDPSDTFPHDRVAMRQAVWASIDRVWQRCAKHYAIKDPDIMVEIYEDPQSQLRWRLTHEDSYEQYLNLLLPTDQLLSDSGDTPQSYDTIDYSNLLYVETMGGRNDCTVIRRRSNPDSLYVFKGINFQSFLRTPHHGYRPRVDGFYHEIRTIRSLPRHMNIVTPAKLFVTVKPIEGDDKQSFVCGTLYPFMENRTLDDQIVKAKSAGNRLDLKRKALWCFQMASAIAHTHLVAHNFHMDIKPANILLDTNQNAVLIDWEQSGAPWLTLAPEADGSWDVVEVEATERRDSSPPELVYKKYRGPPRKNNEWGNPAWNVFPIWRDHHPRALEAAEVFSLGRTMWILLQEIKAEDLEEPEDLVVSWNEEAEDIPKEWRAVIWRCLDPNPNWRIGLVELTLFWERVKDDL